MGNFRGKLGYWQQARSAAKQSSFRNFLTKDQKKYIPRHFIPYQGRTIVDWCPKMPLQHSARKTTKLLEGERRIHLTFLLIRKWFEPRSSIPWLKKIIWVIGVLRRTVVSDWRFDNLCGSHLQSQVVVLVSWKFKNPGERFDWSIDRVAVGKYVMWLAVKTCAEIGYANRWIVKWIINKVLLFPVE